MKQSLDSIGEWNGYVPTVVDNTVLTQRGHPRVALGTGIAGKRFGFGVGELGVGGEEEGYLVGSKMGIVGEGVVAL